MGVTKRSSYHPGEALFINFLRLRLRTNRQTVKPLIRGHYHVRRGVVICMQLISVYIVTVTCLDSSIYIYTSLPDTTTLRSIQNDLPSTCQTHHSENESTK